MLQARYMTGSIQPTIGNLSREHALPQKKQDSAGTLKGLCVLFFVGGVPVLHLVFGAGQTPFDITRLYEPAM